jgi:uncharacterized protein with HEPN domain
MRDRDITVLMKVVQYADEIGETITALGLNLETFKSNHIAKNAIAMCVLQIGELAGSLTDEFKATYNKMPWREIVALRNRTAHAYGTIDLDMLWQLSGFSLLCSISSISSKVTQMSPQSASCRHKRRYS